MMSVWLIGWLLSLQAPAPGVLQQGSSQLMLTLAAPVTRGDGRVSGATARRLTQPFTYYVHTPESPCGATTISATEPKLAGFGWRVAATTISRTATELTVKIEWQRLWERGRALANGPRGSTELTLRREDRVPLDRIPASAQTQCDAVSVGLEVWVQRMLLTTPAADASLGKDIDAQLWLVHTRPDGTERTQLQEIQAGERGLGFFFRAGAIPGTDAMLTVEVSGEIRPVQANGTTVFYVIIERATFDGTGLTPAIGAAGRTIAVPSAGEVISFDMPSAGGRGGGGRSGIGGARGGGGGIAGSGSGVGVSAGGAAAGGRGAARGGGGGGGGGAAAAGAAGAGDATAGGGAGSRPSAVTGLIGPDPLAGHTFSVRLRLR